MCVCAFVYCAAHVVCARSTKKGVHRRVRAEAVEYILECKIGAGGVRWMTNCVDRPQVSELRELCDEKRMVAGQSHGRGVGFIQ